MHNGSLTPVGAILFVFEDHTKIWHNKAEHIFSQSNVKFEEEYILHRQQQESLR